jgi:hypothetical protein
MADTFAIEPKLGQLVIASLLKAAEISAPNSRVENVLVGGENTVFGS